MLLLRGLKYVDYIFGVIFSTSSHGQVTFSFAESCWCCFEKSGADAKNSQILMDNELDIVYTYIQT